jgi:hypothetical protein
MLALPNPITITASSFESFMVAVWADIAVHTPADSSMTIYHANGADTYDAYHNAVHTATLLGARRTGATKINAQWWQVYLFANGARVAILADGSGVTPLTRSYHPRGHMKAALSAARGEAQ